jgi:hypothetical protein
MTTPRKQKLTELSIRSLRPEAAAYVVWDGRQHGLAIRVQPTGGKAWYVVYSLHGRVRWYHIGRVDAVALADARKLAAEIMLDVIRGKDPAAEKVAAPAPSRSSPPAMSRPTPRNTTSPGSSPTGWCGAISCPGGASCRLPQSAVPM